MKENKKSLWYVGILPFHIGNFKVPTNPGVPNEYPFSIGIDQDNGVLEQPLTKNLKDALSKAYRYGSQICTPMGETNLGIRFFNDFIKFITKSFPEKNLKGLNVLEIGCGRGFLIKYMADFGANIVGVDPSLKESSILKDDRIKVIKENFSANLFDCKFDLILHYGVLEHVFDKNQFMKDQLQVLKPTGKIIFGVPCYEEDIESGDISMFMHEHLRYFTKRSLKTFAGNIGAYSEICVDADDAGAAYCQWSKAKSPEKIKNSFDFKIFIERAHDNISKMKNFCLSIKQKGQTLGVYVPGRFMNYHLLLNDSIGDIRFFDDNNSIKHQYFPPIDIPIEDLSDLSKNPPDVVLIMTRTFGNEINCKINAAMVKTPEIFLIDQIITHEHIDDSTLLF